ncbi:OsmC family protein [Sphingobacterium litopenaei]|uniref:OsmC family protein n=1 Tax=Sphingobacterium litopenaei TaxID=2763500 RepID=A0ABR7YAZ8_9SPHI|nr:OsmC family protein [Sphingobacterium litopenaei]MBD1428484.1 OsmC family protein [Sphingobacterium litopenaei]
MIHKHTFKATLSWEKIDSALVDTKSIYRKSHTISIEGKEVLSVSAAKVFKGDPELHNPEDLLLSSLMSCHMMSYLYVCAKNNVEVLQYNDQAQAILETYADGSGKIVEVQINPQVIIQDASQLELALSLHKEANKLCFIANSCNFPVLHAPHCKVNVE